MAPLALAQTVVRKLVVTAVLRAICIDDTKSLTALVCLALVVNASKAGTAIDSSNPVRPIAIISSISVNPRDENCLACAQTRSFFNVMYLTLGSFVQFTKCAGIGVS